MATRRRSARSLRRRNFRMPAASSMIARRSSGVADRIVSSWPCPTITCCWRPMPVSDSSSWRSRSRHGTPFSWYSDSPVRNRLRVIVTSLNSIGRRCAELSIVSDTSARPSAGRLGVPAKMTSSIARATQRARPLCAEHPRDRVDEIRLPRAVRADDDRDARLEVERRLVGERLEAPQGQRLQEQRAAPSPARIVATPSRAGREQRLEGPARALISAEAGRIRRARSPTGPSGARRGPRRASTRARGGPCPHQASTAATAPGGPSRTASTRPSARLRTTPSTPWWTASWRQRSRNQTALDPPEIQRCRRTRSVTLRPGRPRSRRWSGPRSARAG